LLHQVGDLFELNVKFRCQKVNNITTHEDIATKFEAGLSHCVRNVKEKNVLLFKFRCNIFIDVRIIKEMPGSVASGTLCIICNLVEILYSEKEISTGNTIEIA
jgi:hypothetical protein